MATLEISKVGRAVSAEGVTVDFTPAILQEVVANYDPAKHEAPIVIGHPEMDAPSFGWVSSLSFADGKLVATETQVDETFNSLRQKGRYKKPSASFYTPTAPNNPTPGKWNLRHVGFLGAVPPSLKGLNAKTVSFAEKEEGVLTFGELPGYAGSIMASLLGGLRDFFIAKFGQDEADKAIPSYQLESLRSISQRADEAADTDDLSGMPSVGFAEPRSAGAPSPQRQEQSAMQTAEQLQAKNAELETQLAASRQEAATLKAANDKRDAEIRHSGNVSFAEGLIKKAKWPEGHKDALVAVLDHLDQPVATGVVSFGEGTAAKPLGAVFREHLETLPPTLSFSEHARRNEGGGAQLSNAEVGRRARAYTQAMAAKGVTVTAADAVAAVHAGKDKV